MRVAEWVRCNELRPPDTAQFNAHVPIQNGCCSSAKGCGWKWLGMGMGMGMDCNQGLVWAPSVEQSIKPLQTSQPRQQTFTAVRGQRTPVTSHRSLVPSLSYIVHPIITHPLSRFRHDGMRTFWRAAVFMSPVLIRLSRRYSGIERWFI